MYLSQWSRNKTLKCRKTSLSPVLARSPRFAAGSWFPPAVARRTLKVMKVQQPLMSQTSQRDPLKAFNIHQIKEFADISLIAPRGSLEAAPGRMLHISVAAAAAGGLA